MKLLIDECLSTELTKRAQQRGHGQASHVTWIGKQGWKDSELKKVILEGDWTFVTKNSIDFRGPEEAIGSRGQYSDVGIHAGLVCLNGPPGMDLDLQLELFEIALDELDRDDVVNQVLEVNLEEPDAEIEIRRYRLPTDYNRCA